MGFFKSITHSVGKGFKKVGHAVTHTVTHPKSIGKAIVHPKRTFGKVFHGGVSLFGGATHAVGCAGAARLVLRAASFPP